MQSAGKQFCEQKGRMPLMISANKLRDDLETLREAAEGCGNFPGTKESYESLSSFLSERQSVMYGAASTITELVTKAYELPDRPLPNLAHALHASRRWNPMDEGVARFSQTVTLFLEALERATIEKPSIVAASTVKESLTVHSDDEAIDLFAAAMKAKMKHAREVMGRYGWDDPSTCLLDDLRRMFREHVEKGDMVDVANFAMMIWNRIYCIGRERG